MRRVGPAGLRTGQLSLTRSGHQLVGARHRQQLGPVPTNLSQPRARFAPNVCARFKHTSLGTVADLFNVFCPKPKCDSEYK